MAEKVEEEKLQRIPERYDEDYFETTNKDSNMLRYKEKYRQYHTTAIGLIKAFSPKKVLDVGCGRGELVHAFIYSGFKAYGVDVSSYGIQYAKENLRRDVGKEELPFYELDIEEGNLPFQDDSFDLITMFEVIDHLRSYEHCINEIKRVLNQEGHFIIATHNPGSKFSFGDETHVSIRQKEEWIELFKKYGFSEIEDFDQRFESYAVSKPPMTEKGKKMIEEGKIGERARYVKEKIEKHQIIIILKK